ncbi:MAG: Fis family transcriptional regulator [Idiomarinaceae bacterium]|nr:Fis family transcriptional regulator [Idiomarinaceae bacterium]|tara:strand:+ start:26025 stop:26606 length:582 start_codon:yes stop_codon:yes gene_type:complete
MAKERIEIPVEQVRELLDYNPETGDLIWKKRKTVSEHWTVNGANQFNRRYAGTVAGGKRKVKNRDYYRIEVRLPMVKSKVLAHRLAWVLMTGEWPPELIDHIDQDPTNNRWDNLQLASYADNQKNVRLRSDNAIGLSGVSYCKRSGKWIAKTYANGSSTAARHERCDTLLDAAAARFRQLRELGFNPLHGRKK